MGRPEAGHIPLTPGSAPRFRRRALVGLFLFVGLSFALHLTLGPTVTAISPIFRTPDTPDQSVSVVTLSRAKLATVTPTPTPPPKIYVRTIANVAPLKYLEFGTRSARHAIKPPARRTAMLSVHPEVGPSPTAGPDSAAATDLMPAGAPPKGESAQADTGADKSRIAGAVVWGDDNPPRVLSLASLVGGATGAQTGHHVRLEVDIGPDGDVLNVRVVISSGDAALDAAAVDAARKSTYRAATLNGLPVHGTVTLDFPQTTATTT
ncbi:MAG TPA: TonB family protein [Candidatus Eremiobacteraceae bacterium]|nr:TonB family protein [Candidatus Eremiobacteraceae bacterium]